LRICEQEQQWQAVQAQAQPVQPQMQPQQPMMQQAQAVPLKQQAQAAAQPVYAAAVLSPLQVQGHLPAPVYEAMPPAAESVTMQGARALEQGKEPFPAPQSSGMHYQSSTYPLRPTPYGGTHPTSAMGHEPERSYQPQLITRPASEARQFAQAAANRASLKKRIYEVRTCKLYVNDNTHRYTQINYYDSPQPTASLCSIFFFSPRT
jgi:hypothetical protein